MNKSKAFSRVLSLFVAFALVVTSAFVAPTEAMAKGTIKAMDIYDGTTVVPNKGAVDIEVVKGSTTPTVKTLTVMFEELKGEPTLEVKKVKPNSKAKKMATVELGTPDAQGNPTISITVAPDAKNVKKNLVTVISKDKNKKGKVIKKKFSLNIKEIESVKVESVTLNNTTPKVGDTINAAYTPENANNVASINWYVNDKVVEGATETSFTVPATCVPGDKIKAVVSDTEGNTFNSDEAVVAAEETADLAILKAEQTGASTVKISLNKKIDGTAKIEVKRGNTAQTVTPTIADDGLSAVLTLGTAIGAAEYTITVTPADTKEKAATATFTGEVSKLQSLAYKSDYLVLTTANGTAGAVMIKGVDQFGGDVKLTSSNLKLYSSVSTNVTFDNETQTITVNAAAGIPMTQGSKVTVTAIYQNGSALIQEAKELTVSAQAYVASIEFGELATTNAKLKDKRVTLKNFSDDSYYLPITKAEDQYGNALTTKQLGNMQKAGTLFVMPTADMTDYYAKFAGFETLTDGKMALRLNSGSLGKPGTFQVSVSSVGGTTQTKNVTIVDNPYFDELNVTFPELYAGTTAEVTVTAKDQYGDAVNLYDFGGTVSADGLKVTFGDKNNLASLSSSIAVTGNGTFEYVKDTAKKAMILKYTPSATDVATGIQATISSAKPTISVQSIAINDKGYAAGVQGLKKGIETTLVPGQSIDFGKVGNVVFLDNYGAVMPDATATNNTPEYLEGTTTSNSVAAPAAPTPTWLTDKYTAAYYYVTTEAAGTPVLTHTGGGADNGVFVAANAGTQRFVLHMVPVAYDSTKSGAAAWSFGTAVTKNIDVTVTKKADVTYALEISDGKTLHVGSTVDSNITKPSVTVKLTGTSSSGKPVVVDQSDLVELEAGALTATNTGDGWTLTGGKSIAAAGEVELKATVKGVDSRVIGKVKVDTAASKATKSVFKDNTKSDVSPTAANGYTIYVNEPAVASGTNTYRYAYIEDQYGDIMLNSSLKGVNTGNQITGTWTYNTTVGSEAGDYKGVRLQNGDVELLITPSDVGSGTVTIGGSVVKATTLKSFTSDAASEGAMTFEGTKAYTYTVKDSGDNTIAASNVSFFITDSNGAAANAKWDLTADGKITQQTTTPAGTYNVVITDASGTASGHLETTITVGKKEIAEADVTAFKLDLAAADKLTSGDKATFVAGSAGSTITFTDVDNVEAYIGNTKVSTATLGAGTPNTATFTTVTGSPVSVTESTSTMESTGVYLKVTMKGNYSGTFYVTADAVAQSSTNACTVTLTQPTYA